MLLIFIVFLVVLLCVFTYLVPCCNIHHDFHTKAMFVPNFFVGGLISYIFYLYMLGIVVFNMHLILPGIFGGVRVAHPFSFLCCPIMCLYVLTCVL